ncbi:MAG: hypothetical protein ACYC3A_05655 [Halothiobacillus sp.]
MSNLWTQFSALIAAPPLLIGTVTAIRADGLSAVQLPDGRTILARGTGVPVSSNAYVRNGLIEGAAPTLPVDVITLY